jgi:hypothetical protein
MIRTTLGTIILLSMLLHCSSRLGVLSYIYRNRTNISHWLGIVKEKTIASCDRHYFVDKDLKINLDSEDDLPVVFTQAQEIILFINSINVFLADNTSSRFQKITTRYLLKAYLVHRIAVFQPPSLS